MKVIKNLYYGIGLISGWSASVAKWVIPMLIIVVTYEVVARYLFNAPTIWVFDVSSMLYATVVALGFAYVCYHRGNVRVDVIYNKFPVKVKLIIDVVFTLIFFFPVCFVLAVAFSRDALYAYQISEISITACFYPLTWPYKTLVALGFVLLFLQGITIFLKDVIVLGRSKEPW